MSFFLLLCTENECADAQREDETAADEPVLLRAAVVAVAVESTTAFASAAAGETAVAFELAPAVETAAAFEPAVLTSRQALQPGRPPPKRLFLRPRRSG